MVEHLHPASLLPYLHPPAGSFRLNIRLAAGAPPPEVESPPSPFLILGEELAYTHLVAASLATDAGVAVMDLFMLKQSDLYPRGGTEIWSLNNLDIEAHWQNAFRRLRPQAQSPRPADAPWLLQGQIGPQGILLPFDSLFFCRFKARYFQPPCPECGGPLSLCRDDALLARSGLGRFAESLQRYLYCTACAASRPDPALYVPTRDPGHPACVAGFSALVRGFAGLVALSPASNRDMPCIGCTEAAACYGREALADGRLAPFAFFPFYAFLFAAGDLNASDFLKLLGGAPIEELIRQTGQALQPGRRATLRSFQQRHPRGLSRFFEESAPQDARFLETLYLKLSLLAGLADCLLDPRHPWNDSGAFSLDRVWVELPDNRGRLPSAWDFAVRHYGLGLESEETPALADQPPVSRIYFFGQVWFWALLANRDQTMAAIRPALDKLIRGWCSGVSEFRHAGFQEIDPVFRPQNLFFHPEPAPLGEAALRLWQSALELGSSILVACLDMQIPWAADEFHDRLERLRREIAQALFPSVAPAAAPSPVDRQIAGILASLIRKWRTHPPATGEGRTAPGAERAPQPEPAAELAETLILKPAAAKRSAAPAPPVRPAVQQADDEPLLEETVPLRAPRKAPPPASGGQPSEEMPATLIVAPGPAARRPAAPATARTPLPASQAPAAPPPRTADAELEDLAETVIIRSGKEGK